MEQVLVVSRKHNVVNFLTTRTSFLRELLIKDDTRVRVLDGSQIPRLINMRLHKKPSCSYRDFLTTLLGKGSPLIRERIAFRKGMMHWFGVGEDTYENQTIAGKNSLNEVIIDRLCRFGIGGLAVSCSTY
jgi:hypothetical protein